MGGVLADFLVYFVYLGVFWGILENFGLAFQKRPGGRLDAHASLSLLILKKKTLILILEVYGPYGPDF